MHLLHQLNRSCVSNFDPSSGETFSHLALGVSPFGVVLSFFLGHAGPSVVFFFGGGEGWGGWVDIELLVATQTCERLASTRALPADIHLSCQHQIDPFAIFLRGPPPK